MAVSVMLTVSNATHKMPSASPSAWQDDSFTPFEMPVLPALIRLPSAQSEAQTDLWSILAVCALISRPCGQLKSAAFTACHRFINTTISAAELKCYIRLGLGHPLLLQE